MRAFDLDPRYLGPIALTQFATATRFGDLQGVTAADLTVENDVIYISLRVTKTSLTTGPRTVIGTLPTRVVTAVRALTARERPFECPYRTYLAFLKSVRSDLSAHSLRRGAVQAAVRSADDQAVMRLTGHSSLQTK